MQKFLISLLLAFSMDLSQVSASLVSETTTKMPPSDESRIASDKAYDPLESFNRAMTTFNEIFDGLVVGPLVGIYGIMAPDPVKEKVSNFVSNLGTPYTFVNDVLQGEGQRASESFGRFMANTSFGLGGLFDVAEKYLDISPHNEDFGQTLAVWGADDGFYLVLPLLGPSTFRDTLGLGASLFLDPMNYALKRAGGNRWVYGRSALTAFVRRVRSDEAIKYIFEATDPYETARVLYLQNREFEIKNGKVDQESPIPEDL